MLSCIRRPTIAYDLAALADNSYVSVGRETDAHIQLDSQDIPCLLSRKHAHLMLQPGGNFTLVDLGSTNGTFAARQSQPLRKLPPGYAWELQHGDTVGFGGPETIIVKRAQVGNPFLFKYYTPSGWTHEQQHAALAVAPAPVLLPPAMANGLAAAPQAALLDDAAAALREPARGGGATRQGSGATLNRDSAHHQRHTPPLLQQQQNHQNHHHHNSNNNQDNQQQEEDEVMKDSASSPVAARRDIGSRHATAGAQLPVDGAQQQHALSPELANQQQPACCTPVGGVSNATRQQQQHAGDKENAPHGVAGNQAPVPQQLAGRVHHAHHASDPQTHCHHHHQQLETAASGAAAVVVVTPRSNQQKQAQLAERVHTHLTCPVCCDLLVSTHMLHCGHMFCGLCLATWMTQNQSCPSCRKPITGVPVRCFTIDNMISELMMTNNNNGSGAGGGGSAVPPHHMSPSTRLERLRKQEHWDNIQRHIVQDWVTALQRRRDAALQEAARHNQELQQAGAGAGPVPQLPVVPPQQLLQPLAVGTVVAADPEVAMQDVRR